MSNGVAFAIIVCGIITSVLIILIACYSSPGIEDYDKTFILFKCLLVSSAVFLFLIIWGDDFGKWIKCKKEIECKEYKIETIITTKGNISDTTYIIKYK